MGVSSYPGMHNIIDIDLGDVQNRDMRKLMRFLGLWVHVVYGKRYIHRM